MDTHDLYTTLTSSWALALIAIALERWLPWPEQWHPVSLFRLFAQYLENKVNKPSYAPEQQRFAGVLAVLLLLLLTLIPTAIVVYAADFSKLLGAVVLLGCMRRQHYVAVLNKVETLALKRQKRAARALLARIDFRETHDLSLHGLLKATAELRALSIIHHRWAPLIAWLLGGPILALCLRVLIELSSLWPICKPRYRYFGLASRAAYALLLGPVFFVLSLIPATLARLGKRRPAEKIKRSSAWIRPSAMWLDSLSRCHKIALGGPIKVQNYRISRQRFAGIAPESNPMQVRRSLNRWHTLLALLLICVVMLLFIYRP